MRTTSSFDVFPNEPSERELARARWLRKEGRLTEAEQAYRGVMSRQPSLRTGWTECFELLRSVGRIEEALTLATAARGVFEEEAFPLTLEGAAFIELGNYRKALAALESAVNRDPDLALTWHELGYAAYRMGDGSRALAALDRAFALEPHTETLLLRGRILRDAGEYYAAEVAFEGALHSATHADQEHRIREEIHVTRRRGAFAPAWVQALTPAQEWFALHGAVVLASEASDRAPTDQELFEAMLQLTSDRGWEFGQILVQDPDSCSPVLQTFGVEIATWDKIDPRSVPLVTASELNQDPFWRKACDLVHESGRGATMVVRHPLDRPAAVDIVGELANGDEVLALLPEPSTSLIMAQHPAARLITRILKLNP
jgi:tetratricopeptide (TPR) repeat protein